MSVDYAAVTGRQQQVWSLGDYGRVGSLLGWLGETLVHELDVHATERVLDVAAGNGNASLPALRRFADVLATDYVPALLEEAQARARADGLGLRTQVADAQALPFEDDEFDVVMSTIGAMFAPDQDAVARELARVCRPGGRIGMANWTPDSGRRHVPHHRLPGAATAGRAAGRRVGRLGAGARAARPVLLRPADDASHLRLALPLLTRLPRLVPHLVRTDRRRLRSRRTGRSGRSG